MSTRDVLPRRLNGRWTWLWTGVLGCAIAWWTPPAGLLAQEEDDDDKPTTRPDPYDQIVELRQVEYLPPSAGNKKQTLRFTFNVAPHVPKGARINFELEYNALPFDNANFVLEGQNRRGLRFEWSPKKKLAMDTYYLRVRLYPNDQTPDVKKLIERNPRKFPMNFEPWPWYYLSQPVEVGTEAERRAQQEEMCALYGKFMDGLVANYAEFHELMDKVKAGEEAVTDGKLDEKKFEKLVVDWREKQGKLQQEIQELVVTNPVFATISPKAYRLLNDLGRMVSDAAVDAQNAVTDQYGVDRIRPKKQHRYFNARYPYATGKEQLNDQLGKIEIIVCAHLFAEETAEGDPDAKKGDAKKGDAKRGDAEKGDAKKKGDGEKDGAGKVGTAKRSSR